MVAMSVGIQCHKSVAHRHIGRSGSKARFGGHLQWQPLYPQMQKSVVSSRIGGVA